MFSWICPTCGRDVPPSKTECPYCAEREREAKEAAAAVPVVAQPSYTQEPPSAPWQQPPAPQYAPQQYAPQQYAQPQQYAPAPQAAPPAPPPHWQPPPQPPQQQPPQQQYAPPAQYPPQYAQQPPAAWPPQTRRSAPPMWLMVVGFALAFLLVGGGIYYFMQRPAAGNNPAEKAGLENPADASKQKVSNPLQKYVEVVGLRMIQDGKKPVARFVVVNHSSTEIADLKANVTLWASTSRSEEDSIGSFSFALPSIGPNESKELTEPLKTKLKTYEYPDWQNATAEIQITSPTP